MTIQGKEYEPGELAIGKMISKAEMASISPVIDIKQETKDWLTKCILEGAKKLIEFHEETTQKGDLIVIAKLKVLVEKKPKETE